MLHFSLECIFSERVMIRNFYDVCVFCLLFSDLAGQKLFRWVGWLTLFFYYFFLIIFFPNRLGKYAVTFLKPIKVLTTLVPL